MEWKDGKCRCRWANPRNERYIRYHDEEWGSPVHDDKKLFEMLILESFQAGLSEGECRNCPQFRENTRSCCQCPHFQEDSGGIREF